MPSIWTLLRCAAAASLVLFLAAWATTIAAQVRARALASRTTAGFDAQGRAVATEAETGHWLELRWNRRNDAWIVNADYDDISPRFRNDNGFVDQAGVRRFEGELIRRWGEQAIGTLQAREFETYLWTQHARAREDATLGVAREQTVARRWRPGIWFVGPMNSEGWMQLRLDAERVRPGGRLHPVRGVGAQYGLNPAPWFTRLTMEFNAGQRVDVEADRRGHGADGFVEATVRGSIAGVGVESEHKLQAAVLRRDGQRVLSDSAARWLGVVHLSARDSLRLVWQAARYRRAADSALGIAAAHDDSRALSLVFQHRVGLGRNLSLGVTRARIEPGAQRKDELFFKAAVAL
jgi:hypothetical protein